MAETAPAPNIAFYAFMVTTACTECGNPLMLDGPQLRVPCRTCQSLVEMQASEWADILGYRKRNGTHLLAEGETRSGSSHGRDFTIRIKCGPQRPLCVCGVLLDLRLSPPGATSDVPCACGKTTTTFPPPSWLKEVVPDIMQLWGATREGASVIELPQRDDAKPVSFACPDCGANLKITTETARVLECSYCKNDLFLPDALWYSLHPVRKRARWFAAFES